MSEQHQSFKARPMPNLNKPPKLPSVKSKPVTIPETPNLATKARASQHKPAGEDKVDTTFKAREISREVYAGPSMPAISSKPITIPETPNISTTNKPPTRVMEEGPTEFKARPVPRDAFAMGGQYGLPTTEAKEITIPETPQMSTRERADRWRELEAEKAAREAVESEARREAEAVKAAEDKEKLRRMREGLVHKARPVPGFYNKDATDDE